MSILGNGVDREYWKEVCDRVPGAIGGLHESRWRDIVDRLIAELSIHHTVMHNVDRYLAGTAEEPSLRELLLWTYMTIRAAPAEILQDFKVFKETELDWAESEASRTSFQLGTPPDNHRLILLALGGALRAMDGFLTSVSVDSAPAIDELGREARRWELPSYGFYIAPADRTFRAGVNRPFIRRALKSHTILPTRLGNNSVTLHHHNQLIPGEGSPARQPMRYGAAVFPELALGLRHDAETFVVESIVSDGHAERIAEHLDAAHAHECDVLLWPELTLDWTAIERIQKVLKKEARQERKNMKVVLAGSAHVQDAGPPAGFRNRTRILDGRGQTLVEYDKRMKFSFASKRLPGGKADPAAPRLTEAIIPGRDLPILVLEDRLVAIAICLDFCEKSGGLLPYHHLDVDLVLVPSMGFRNTTDLHLEQAHTMHVEYDTEVFLVQQTPVVAGEGGRSPDDPAGYSALTPSGLNGGLAQNEAFRAYRG